MEEILGHVQQEAVPLQAVIRPRHMLPKLTRYGPHLQVLYINICG